MLSTCCKRFVRWLAGRRGSAVIFGWGCCALRQYPECLWCQAEGTGSSLLPAASGQHRQCPIVFDRGRKFRFHLHFLCLAWRMCCAWLQRCSCTIFELGPLISYHFHLCCLVSHILIQTLKNMAEITFSLMVRLIYSLWVFVAVATERWSYRSADISALIFCPFGNLLQLSVNRQPGHLMCKLYWLQFIKNVMRTKRKFCCSCTAEVLFMNHPDHFF